MKKLLISLFLVALVAGCKQAAPQPAPADTTPTQPVAVEPTTTEGLMTKTQTPGEGAAAKAGDTVTVHYVGALTNGTKFDSSRDRGEPFVFTLGAGEVIKGWDQGIVGMKVGEVRHLTIPPELGYGGQAVGKIPPNSTLVFQVELLKIN